MARLKSIVQAPHWLFCIIALIFGSIFVFLVPPLWGLDETAHFARVYQLSRGELIPDKGSASQTGGLMPKNYNALVYYAVNDIGEEKVGTVFSRKDINDTSGYKNFTNQKFSKEQKQSIGTASYSPLAYAGPTLGTFFARIFNFSVGHTIAIARLFSLVTYIALVWLALRVLKGRKITWLVMIVALLPVSIFQASVLSADSMANALSFLFFALLFTVLQKSTPQTNKKLLVGLVATAMLLPLIKINYIFLSFGILLVSNTYFSTMKKAILTKLVATMLIIVPGIIWSMLTRVAGNATSTQRPDGLQIVASEQMGFMLHHPLAFAAVCVRSVIVHGDAYLQELTSVLGWNYVVMPILLTLFLIVAMLIAGTFAKDELLKLKRSLIILNLLCLLGAASIFAALYVAFTPVAHSTVDGVQGRYFIPFLIPLVSLIATLLPVDIKIAKRVVPYLFGGAATIALIVGTVFYLLVTY